MSWSNNILMLSRCAVGHLINGFLAEVEGIMSLWLEEERGAGAEGWDVVGAEKECFIPWNLPTAFFPSKEFLKISSPSLTSTEIFSCKRQWDDHSAVLVLWVKPQMKLHNTLNSGLTQLVICVAWVQWHLEKLLTSSFLETVDIWPFSSKTGLYNL